MCSIIIKCATNNNNRKANCNKYEKQTINSSNNMGGNCISVNVYCAYAFSSSQTHDLRVIIC